MIKNTLFVAVIMMNIISDGARGSRLLLSASENPSITSQSKDVGRSQTSSKQTGELSPGRSQTEVAVPMLQAMDDSAVKDGEIDTAAKDKEILKIRREVGSEMYEEELRKYRELQCKDKVAKYGCCVPCFGCCCNDKSGCAMWNIWFKKGEEGGNARGKLFDALTCCGCATMPCCVKGNPRRCACMCCLCDWSCDQCRDYWKWNKAMLEYATEE